MFIIQMGEAEVISSLHSPVILKKGDIFGEVCLINLASYSVCII